MSVLWLHLRTGFVRWTAAPLALLALLILFQRNTYWIGIWPEAGAAVVTCAFFLSLFSAGIAAWASARNDLHRIRIPVASAQATWVVEMLRLVACLLWLVAAYVVAVLGAFVVTVPERAPGLLFFIGYVLLGLFLLVMATVWGWLVGRLLTPAFAAAAAFFSWFVISSLLGRVAELVPVAGPPWTDVSITAVLARLLAILPLYVAVCLFPEASAQQARWKRLTAVAASGGIAVATLAVTPALTPREPVARPLCVEGRITYCLWPEHQKYVSLVEQVDRRVAELPLDLELPPEIVDYSLSGSTVVGDDGIERELVGDYPPEFFIAEGSPWSLASSVSFALAVGIIDDCSPEAPLDPEMRSEQLAAWLESRLAGGGDIDYTTNAPPDMEEAWAKGRAASRDLDDDAQAAWANSLVGDIKSNYCYVS